MAAAMGSSINSTERAPAERAASSTARCSTPVTPEGTQITMPRVGPPGRADLADEVAQHLLGDLEVGDHAVLERPDRGDRAGRAAQHALGLGTDGVHLAGAMVDGHHRRLGEHDAVAAHIDQGVGGAQVDRHVARAEAWKEVERPIATPFGPWVAHATRCRERRQTGGVVFACYAWTTMERD